MALTLVSTPEPVTSPALNSKWLASESPNNFRFQREDWGVTDAASSGSPAGTTLTLNSAYTGAEGNIIAFYSDDLDAVFTGEVISISGSDVLTSIVWNAAFATGYMQDNTLRGGYCVEGRLTINGVLNPLTIYASPDLFGVVDLDVSGVLRTVTTLGKTGDYSSTLMAEPLKSGKFTLEYRESWYGSDETWSDEGNDWYYAEVVRSEEQGSNLYDYVVASAPFLNLFERPVYFNGLPFDISFLLPDDAGSAIIVVSNFNAQNTPGTVNTYTISGTPGQINSLAIIPSMLDSDCAYITASITW